jgi:hypothetical protein
VSSDLPQRFRNLAALYTAVLEHWRVFWERINAEDRNVRLGAAVAWEKFRDAFIIAARALGELRQEVPKEVADLRMDFTYSGPLRVREALDGQAEFFEKWLLRVTEAEDVCWIWRTDFHRYMEWLDRDEYDLVRAAKACEEWDRKQEAEKIVKALEQPAPLESCDQAEAVTTRLENALATPEETAQPVVTKDAQFQPTTCDATVQNDSADSRRRRGWWVKEAVKLVSKYPELSNNQIAAMLGIHPSTLSKNNTFQKVAADIRQQGNIRQGYHSGAKIDGIVAPVEEDD